MIDEIKQIALKCMINVVKNIKPYIGKGEPFIKAIDYIATYSYGSLIDELSPFGCVTVLGVEGARDGVKNTRLQCQSELVPLEKADIILTLDPIDGTKAAAHGISRAMTALGIYIKKGSERNIRPLPDSLSCFYAASKVNKEFLNNLHLSKYENSESKTVSTIRRIESMPLWKKLLEVKDIYGYVGEPNLYMANMLYNNVFFAGDTSLPLFIESDSFLGRSGATEALLESRLWKYWSGIIMSGKKMKRYTGGELKYIEDRIKAIDSNNYTSLLEFFEETEIFELHALGWTNEEINRVHFKDTFSPNYDLIIIGSITGTKDLKLPIHSSFNFDAIKTIDNNSYIHTYIKEKEHESLSYCRMNET